MGFSVKVSRETPSKSPAALARHLVLRHIDTGRMKPPAFKMVLTAVGNYAYRRRGDVVVAPVSALKP